MDGEEEMYAQTANDHQGMLLTLPNVRKPVKAAKGKPLDCGTCLYMGHP